MTQSTLRQPPLDIEPPDDPIEAATEFLTRAQCWLRSALLSDPSEAVQMYLQELGNNLEQAQSALDWAALIQEAADRGELG